MFSFRNKKNYLLNYPCYSFLSGALRVPDKRGNRDNFPYFSMKKYVVTLYKLMRGHNITEK